MKAGLRVRWEQRRAFGTRIEFNSAESLVEHILDHRTGMTHGTTWGQTSALHAE